MTRCSVPLMKEAATSSTQSDSELNDRVPFIVVLFVYLAIWFLADIAFHVLTKDVVKHSTSSDLIVRLSTRVMETPINIIAGLSLAVGEIIAPDSQDADWLLLPTLIGVCVFGHAVLTLSCVRRRAFIAFSCAQVLLLTVGVIFHLRQIAFVRQTTCLLK